MADVSDEQWLPVPGYEGMYSVSSWGRIRSEARLVMRGGRPMRLKETIRNCGLDKDGYPQVTLASGSRSKPAKLLRVHQVVLRAFCGPPPPGHEGRHLDGHPPNNRLDNLSYGTRAENVADAKGHGTFESGGGQLFPRAKLSPQSVIEIRASAETIKVLAERYGVRPGTISKAKRGRTWKIVRGGETTQRRDYTRIPRGEGHCRAILTDAIILAIRASTDTCRSLAAKYATTATNISMIRKRQTWKHVT